MVVVGVLSRYGLGVFDYDAGKRVFCVGFAVRGLVSSV